MDNTYNDADFVNFIYYLKVIVNDRKLVSFIGRGLKENLWLALVAPKKEEKEKELYWLEEHITVIEQSLYMCNQEDKNATEEEEKGKAEYKERLLLQKKGAEEKLERFYSNFETEINEQFNRAIEQLTAEEKGIAVKIWQENIDFREWLDEYLKAHKNFIFLAEDPINDN